MFILIISHLSDTCRRWVLQNKVHQHARKVVLRPPFQAWRELLAHNEPMRALRRSVAQSHAKRVRTQIFLAWRRVYHVRRFVRMVVREYECARTRGLARVALRRWRRWSVKHAIGSEILRYGMKKRVRKDN